MADSSIFSDSDPTRRLFGDNRLFPERTPVFGWDAAAPGMNDPRPDPVSQMRAARVSTALVDGTVLSPDELAARRPAGSRTAECLAEILGAESGRR